MNNTSNSSAHRPMLLLRSIIFPLLCSIRAFSQTPVVDYHFNGDYLDSSSSSNNGIASGNVFITTASNEVAAGSGALSLDGAATSYVDLTTPLVFSSSQPWSAAFWAKRSSLGDNRSMIMGDRNNTTDFIWLNDTFAGLRFRSTSNTTLDFTVPQDTSFHHYALVADGAGKLDLFRDGSFLQSLSGNTDFRITTIGKASSTSYIFKGIIDEVHVYPQVLTSNQIYSIYTNEYREPTQEPTQQASQVTRLRVFLQGGQSNADGRADPSGQPTYSDIDFFSATETRAGALTPLYAGASETGKFGPELGFGRRIADILGCDSTNRVAIIKYANGGTTLYSQWYGGGDGTTSGDGPEYTAFQQAVTEGLATLAAEYTNATIAIEGMIWMQGESDAVASYSTRYYSNLTNFIADVRATYGTELPFIIGRLSSNQTGAAAALIKDVQDGQSAAAAESTRNGLVYTESFPLQDVWHFNAEGQLGLGKAFADEMAYIIWVTSQLTPAEIDAGKGEPNADPDMDGVVNSDEFIAGTDVMNADSRFTVGIDISNNAIKIQHPSQTSRLYRIESCSNLVDSSWTNITTYTNGIPVTSTYTVTNNLQTAFYRVRVQLP